MKTLDQIKNDYAKSKGYPSFNILLRVSSVNKLNEHTNELLIIVQKECLNIASENAYIEPMGMMTRVDKQSITNEKNIIR